MCVCIFNHDHIKINNNTIPQNLNKTLIAVEVEGNDSFVIKDSYLDPSTVLEMKTIKSFPLF